MSIAGNQNPSAVNETYLHTFQDLGLEQLVDFPTRYNPDNTLDLALTNRPSLVQRCVAIPGLSDHAAVLITTKLRPAKSKPPKRKILLWKRADMIALRHKIDDLAREFTTTHTTATPIQVLWDTFASAIQSIMKDQIPSKWSSSCYTKPWANATIKRLSRRQKKALKKYRQTKRPKDLARMKKLQKAQRAECRRAYHQYLMGILDPDAGKSKRLYSYVKSLKKDSSTVGPLRNSEGILQSDAATQATLLNNQFASVFTDEDTTDMPDLNHAPFSDMDTIVIHENGVAKMLRNIKPHKATGPDEIPARLLKEAADQLAPILTLIFQASYNQGTVPAAWRQADVVPVFKKGDPATPSNYRPISLTAISCKLMEHIMQTSIMRHLDNNAILHDSQHGFRKRRSCETQLLLTTADIHRALDNNIQADGILLDFSKAFDKVPHKRLALKLDHYGVRGNTLSWIKSFLADRTQKVVLNGKQSETIPVTSGVPQGTVLGPLLFLIYINDLPDSVSHSTTRLFADDCLMYRNIRSARDAELLQQDMDQLQIWEKDWLMNFNASKCQTIHFSRKRNPITKTYTIHGEDLESVDNATYLGVKLNSTAAWGPHCNSTSRKSECTRAFLQRNLAGTPRQIKTECFKTLLRPILEYASTVWDPHTKSDADKLERTQRRYARFVCNDHSRESSVTAMLRTLDWDTLAERRGKSRATMMFRMRRGLVDIPIEDHLTHLNTRTRGNGDKFRVPYTRTLSARHSFFPDVSRIWNNLPDVAISSDSIDQFKSQLAGLSIRA